MKKLTYLFLTFCFTVACNAKPQPTAAQPETTAVQPPKVLVAYFSRTGENYDVGNITVGNTQKVAQEIARQTGGTLFHIQTVKTYPTVYKPCTKEAQQEQAANARPALKTTVTDMDQYDIVYLGYPIWWGDMPMGVYTFLESYNWAGKKVYPFATHEGSGMGRTESTLSKALPKAMLGKGLALYGHTAQNDPKAVQTAVANWISTHKE